MPETRREQALRAGAKPKRGPKGPHKYKQEFAKQARKLCALGATDRDLAEFFDVTTVTIWRWRCTHKEFCNALIVGKGPSDDRVVRSLYQRAVGYSYQAVKIMSYEGTAFREEYVEHVPPDTAPPSCGSATADPLSGAKRPRLCTHWTPRPRSWSCSRRSARVLARS